MIIYDNNFDANEWFVLGAVIIGVFVVLLLPKRFTRLQTVLFYMCGVYSGFFFDHTLSVMPVSFYDVNDVSKFEVMDFVSYWMYGPMSYLFFYVTDVLHLRLSQMPVWMLVWALIGCGLETLGINIGVYHYQHGYKIFYSLAIYLLVNCAWTALYFGVRRPKPRSIG